MPAGELPTQVVDVLHRARQLEHAAVGTDQQRRAIAATGALMLAAAHDGWQVKLLADAVGISRAAAQKRIEAARARYGDQRPAVTFLPPGVDLGDWTPRRGRRWKLAELRTPVEDREWLSLTEAAGYLDTPRRTVHSWNRDGLLPNTREVAKGNRLYLRADLDRVRHAPRRGDKQLDRRALLEQIRASSV